MAPCVIDASVKYGDECGAELWFISGSFIVFFCIASRMHSVGPRRVVVDGDLPCFTLPVMVFILVLV